MKQIYTDIVIVLILAYTVLTYFRRGAGDVSFVRSNVDGKEYLVRNLKDKQHAADMLANIRIQLQQFVSYLNNKHPSNTDVQRLVSRFNPNQISEGDYDIRYTTYTLNKGEKIVFCLRSRSKQSEEIHRKNLLMFVAIHELAHIMTVSQGHTDEFKENFTFLLREAVDAGVYQAENFKESPENYCGMDVTDTPLY